MIDVCDELSPEEILKAFSSAGGQWTGPINVLQATDSTNNNARSAAQNGAIEGTTFTAEEQSAGRGRRGRSWSAPKGSALLFSTVVRPNIAPVLLPPLSLCVGLAVHDVISRYVDRHRVRVKWPNDVLVDSKKLAGILIESSIQNSRVESVTVGVGLNVYRASLPPEISERAICLQAAINENDSHSPCPNRSTLLGQLLAALEKRVRRYETSGLGGMLDELRAVDGAKGRQVNVDGVEGVAIAINDDGSLMVQTASGIIAALAADFTD